MAARRDTGPSRKPIRVAPLYYAGGLALRMPGIIVDKARSESVETLMQEPQFYRRLGRRIRALRIGQQLTQEQLAVRIAMPRTSITHIERGQQQVLVHTLCSLAHALGVSIAEIIPAAGEATPLGIRKPARSVSKRPTVGKESPGLPAIRLTASRKG